MLSHAQCITEVEIFVDFKLREYLVPALVLSKIDDCDTVFYTDFPFSQQKILSQGNK